MIEKAGEVTISRAKQACIALDTKGIDYFNYVSFIEAIRAIPGVKPEDLK